MQTGSAAFASPTADKLFLIAVSLHLRLHIFEHFKLQLQAQQPLSNKNRLVSLVKGSQEGYLRAAGRTDSTFAKHMDEES